MNNKKNKGLLGSQFALLLLIGILVMIFFNRGQMKNAEVSYTTFVKEVEQGKITDAVIRQNKEVPTGVVTVRLKDEDKVQIVNVSNVEEVQEMLADKKVDYRMTDIPKDSFLKTFVGPLFTTMLAMMLVFTFMNRQAGGGACISTIPKTSRGKPYIFQDSST